MEQLAYLVVFFVVLLIVGIFVTGFLVAKIGLIAIVYVLAVIGFLTVVGKLLG